MSDQTIQEIAPRQSGRFGIVRGESPTSLAATIPATLSAPASFDATWGWIKRNMFGNADWGDCFWAAVANGTDNQALTGIDEKQNPVFADGYTPVADEAPIAWFQTYLASQGSPATEPPGAGTGIYSGAQSILDQNLAYAVGVVGPDEGGEYAQGVIREAVFDTDGGAILCLALDPKAMQEFNDHEPWGTLSTNPDFQDGHAVDGCAFGPTDDVALTWQTIQGLTFPFAQKCIDGLVLIVTHAFVLKNGQEAADALVAKWGLTLAPAPIAPPVADPTPDPTPAPEPTVKPSGLFPRIRDFIDREFTRNALKRDLENVALPEVEGLVLDELVKLAERFGI